MTRTDLTRRRALEGLAGLGLTAALPLSRAWAEAGGPSLAFLAVGDWGREGSSHQRDVAVRMGESAKEIGTRFVISVGDNFYEDGVTGLDDPAWQQPDALLAAENMLQISSLRRHFSRRPNRLGGRINMIVAVE